MAPAARAYCALLGESSRHSVNKPIPDLEPALASMLRFASNLLLFALFASGLLMLHAGYDEGRASRALADRGVETTATVTKIAWIARGRNPKKYGDENHFRASIAFATADNVLVHADLNLPEHRGPRLRDQLDTQQAATLQIKYLPDDTSVVALPDHEDGSRGLYIAGVVLLLAGAVVWLRRRRKSVDVVTE